MPDVSYIPNSAPTVEDEDTQQLAFWAENELDRIADSFNEVAFIRVSVLNAAPEKPRNGMLVYADGTNWDPGSGVGFYGYENGSWVKL